MKILQTAKEGAHENYCSDLVRQLFTYTAADYAAGGFPRIYRPRRRCDTAADRVAKYVAALEEHGLIRTERTEIITRDGLKRNGCLRYTILPIRYAIDLFHDRQLSELEFATARQKAKTKAQKLGATFTPAAGEQSA